MRPLIALFLLVGIGSAYAQYPWPYQQYGGRHNGAYSQPAPRSPPRSLAYAMLDAHNAIRSRAGVPPLVWSAELAGVAQDWARHLLATRSFAHRPNNRYGENIYAISGGASSPAQVASSWADEVGGYDIRHNTCRGVCGHYTQIVWRSTRMIGCGIATDAAREVWVCNYDPAGNINGERPY